MNHRATLASPTIPTLTEQNSGPLAPAADSAAKPKVMRRPAQFSKPTARTEPAFTADTRIEAPTANTPAATQQAPTLRPWQEDGRFAFALLAIVIIVNLALSIWLAPAPSTAAAALAPSSKTSHEITSSAPESLIYHLNEAGASVSEQ